MAQLELHFQAEVCDNMENYQQEQHFTFVYLLFLNLSNSILFQAYNADDTNDEKYTFFRGQCG